MNIFLIIKKSRLLLAFGFFFVGVLPVSAAGDYWTEKALSPRQGSVMHSVINNKLYNLGTSWWGSNFGDQVYDPVTDSWTILSSNPRKRYAFTHQTVNGKIYVIGGVNFGGYETNIVDEYNPQTDTWLAKSSMAYSRQAPYSVVINDKIYAMYGSACGACSNMTIVVSNEEYNTQTDTWTTKTSPPSRDPWSGSFKPLIIGSKMYGINRSGWGTNSNNHHWEYDSQVDIWTPKAQMPTPLTSFASVVLGNKIYVIGGDLQTNCPVNLPCTYVSYNLNQMYDPATNTWTNKAPLSSTRAGAGVVLNGKIYVLGGSSNGGWTPKPYDNEEYDPQVDIWTTRASSPNSINGYLAPLAVLGDKIYTPPYAVFFLNSLKNTEYTPFNNPTGCVNNKDDLGNELKSTSGKNLTPNDRKAGLGSKIKASDMGNRCFGNTGGKMYFVPQGTTAEFDSFWNNIESGRVLDGLYKIN